jgi:hypothetical protein
VSISIFMSISFSISFSISSSILVFYFRHSSHSHCVHCSLRRLIAYLNHFLNHISSNHPENDIEP